MLGTKLMGFARIEWQNVKLHLVCGVWREVEFSIGQEFPCNTKLTINDSGFYEYCIGEVNHILIARFNRITSIEYDYLHVLYKYAYNVILIDDVL